MCYSSIRNSEQSALTVSLLVDSEPMLPTMVRQFHYMEEQLEVKLKRNPNGIRVEGVKH